MDTQKIEAGASSQERKSLNDYIEGASRMKAALLVAGCSTIFSLIGWIGGPSNVWFISIGLLGSLVSYLLAGGIGTAVKWASKTAKWGWLLVPIFPIDVFVGLLTLFAVFFTLLFLPIVIVYKRYKEES